MKLTVNSLVNTIWVMTGILAVVCLVQSLFVG